MAVIKVRAEITKTPPRPNIFINKIPNPKQRIIFSERIDPCFIITFFNFLKSRAVDDKKTNKSYYIIDSFCCKKRLRNSRYLKKFGANVAKSTEINKGINKIPSGIFFINFNK